MLGKILLIFQSVWKALSVLLVKAREELRSLNALWKSCLYQRASSPSWAQLPPGRGASHLQGLLSALTGAGFRNLSLVLPAALH